jgi:hypothetical protein
MPQYPEGDYVAKVCKAGERAAQCRYLASCGPDIGWSCEKKSTIRPLIDLRVERGLQKAQGDNCAGLDWR